MIKKLYKYQEGRLHVVFGITGENQIRLLHFSSVPFEGKVADDVMNEPDNYHREGYQFAGINLSGYDRPYERQGEMYTCTVPGVMMKFAGLTESRNEKGRVLTITQADFGEEQAGALSLTDRRAKDHTPSGAVVTTTVQFYDGISVARFINNYTNSSDSTQTLEYLGSFSYLGIDKEGIRNADHKMRIYIPHNSWQHEIAWQDYSLEELGIANTQPHVFNRTSKTIAITNTGHWSAKDYLPMGYVENLEADTGLVYEIEQNGSWHAEYGTQNGRFFLNLSGPTETQSHFYKNIAPGESFESVPVAVGVSKADVSQAMGELDRYRRLIRRPNRDDEELPVIFNDYMNCLFGDPTTAKELPLVDAAANAGCEYYVIDAGWYAPGEWWAGVGEWEECRERFPNGIRELTDYIRSKGMIPGVWLELEVMGINCDLAKKVPDDWFFIRHGKRVYDRSRYQLDFRNPAVIEHVTGVIDKVVNEYGVGYIKMDYNIEPGIGTEIDADSVGDGLLRHERAYLEWLDGIFRKYPDLVIENCSSGGLRMDYAMLSRYSIQSTSDQEDYIQYSTIAANVPSALTSEQAAVWSYPLRQGNPEEAVFNMVNAMLCRIHQSGHLAELSKERFDLVREGIDLYKKIRCDIRQSVPYWPLGLAHTSDPYACLVVKTNDKAYMALWRRGTPDTGAGSDFVTIPLRDLWRDENEKEGTGHGSSDGHGVKAGVGSVRIIYPEKKLAEHCDISFAESSGDLTVEFTEPVMARLFEIK